jgi:protein-tyrosine phosphatase
MKIVFVCTGNICRSPMGEALLMHLAAPTELVDLRVSSCGTWGLAGEPATDLAVDVLRDRGIDASAHLARDLDPGEIEEADLVIAMTSVHLREIEKAAPHASHKVRLLKEIAELTPALTPGGPPAQRLAALLAADRPRWRRELDLDDPMGLPRGVYERCAEEVEAGVSRLILLLTDRS